LSITAKRRPELSVRDEFAVYGRRVRQLCRSRQSLYRDIKITVMRHLTIRLEATRSIAGYLAARRTANFVFRFRAELS
jgi:uncharacterized protein (DUF2062 family)